MKKLLLAAALAASAVLPAHAETAISLSIGEPGFYGRIDIGGMPPPPVVVATPVIVQREVHVVAQPVYLRVPDGHRKKWAKYCGRYDACGRPVYFVQDSWYVNDYAPSYRARHGRGHGGDHPGNGHGGGHGGGHGKGHGRGH